MLKMISMREKEIKPDGSPDLQKRMESIRKVNILKKMKDLSLSLSIYIYILKNTKCAYSHLWKNPLLPATLPSMEVRVTLFYPRKDFINSVFIP